MFQHDLPFDRSSLDALTPPAGRGTNRAALLQEGLSVAQRSGAIEIKDLARVRGWWWTTVQEQAIAHPTEGRLTHHTIEKLVDQAKRDDVELRQG